MIRRKPGSHSHKQWSCRIHWFKCDCLINHQPSPSPSLNMQTYLYTTALLKSMSITDEHVDCSQCIPASVHVFVEELLVAVSEEEEQFGDEYSSTKTVESVLTTAPKDCDLNQKWVAWNAITVDLCSESKQTALFLGHEYMFLSDIQRTKCLVQCNSMLKKVQWRSTCWLRRGRRLNFNELFGRKQILPFPFAKKIRRVESVQRMQHWCRITNFPARQRE